MVDLRDRTALVTGASGGLGEQFARRLARDGMHLVLVARSADRLDALARDLRSAHPSLRVETVAMDLSQPDSPAVLEDRVRALSIDVDLLVDDAGSAVHGDFADVPLERTLAQIDLDVRALVDLTGRFLPGMLQRRRGWVLDVASTAAFQPMPGTAVHGAAKAFVRSFSEALRFEVRDSGVRVMALAPGPMSTGFFRAAGAEYLTRGRATPAGVVDYHMRRLGGPAPTVIPGLGNRFVVLGERFAPRRLLVRGAARATRVPGASGAPASAPARS